MNEQYGPYTNKNPDSYQVIQQPVAANIKQPHRFRTAVAGLALCAMVSGVTSAGVVSILSGQQETTSAITTSALQLTNTAATGSTDGSVASVAAKAADSVVEITTETAVTNPRAMQYVTEGAGSGVILSEDGYIVTNYHVIEGASTVTVRLTDGSEYTASLVGTDSTTDLAVLKIDATGLTAATLADSDSASVGELAVAIGNPLGELGGTVTSGIISALDREITIDSQTMTLLQTSAAVNPGNSGGGLFNDEGNLVGIINAKSSGTDIEGLAFAIPSNTVAEVVAEIMENGYVTGRPQLGISVVEITDAQTAMMYRVDQAGVYIGEAHASTGLVSSDLLVSIDGIEIATTSDISDVLAEHQIGDTVEVVVQRNGSNVTATVILTEQVPASVAFTQSAEI